MTDDQPQATIYTDGGAKPNPGKGGWAAAHFASHQSPASIVILVVRLMGSHLPELGLLTIRVITS